jgi:hypothetical protein
MGTTSHFACTSRPMYTAASSGHDGRMRPEPFPPGLTPAPVPTRPDERQLAPSPRPTVDEVSESSFPASDPPSAWTWEVDRRPDNA